MVRSLLESSHFRKSTLAIVFLVLLFSAAIGFVPSDRYLLAILGGLLGIAGLVAVLRWPIIGIVGIVLASFFIGLSIGTGTQTRLHAATLLLIATFGLWLIEKLARKERQLLPQHRAIYAIALFILCFVVSFGFGQLPWFNSRSAPMTAQIGQVAIFFLSCWAFLLTAAQIKSLKELETVTWVFIICGGFFLFGRVVSPLQPFVNRMFQYGSTTTIFLVWLPVMALGQAIYNNSLKPIFRFALICIVAGIIYIQFVRERSWISGWLPALVGLAVVIWIGTPKSRPFILMTAALMLIFLTPQRLTNVVMVGDNAYSFSTRVEAWAILARMMLVNPLFGLGPANYYYYTPLFPILGYAVRFNSHNNYVDIAAQTGIIGLACFLWIMFEIFRSIRRVQSKIVHELPEAGFVKAYAHACMGGLAGTLTAAMLGDWVIPFVYNVGFTGFRASLFGWLFLGGIVAIERLVLGKDFSTR